MKFFKLFIIVNVILISTICCSTNYKSRLKQGDIIFQTSQSSQSKAIQLATRSSYSHAGIIFIDNGQYFVYEAVQPVKITPLDEWIERGVDKHFVVKRLKNADQFMTPGIITAMKSAFGKYKGKDYDIYFEWTDERIYCSELVWKLYKEVLNIEIGSLQRLQDFNLSHPIVASLLQKRFGDNVPYNEPVISPAAIFQSKMLFTVLKN